MSATPPLLKRDQLIKILTAVLILLQIPLWLGSGSVFSLLYTYYEQHQVVKQTRIINAENDALLDKIAALKQGPDEVSARARSELGLIGQNEYYYQMVSQS
jgi:cell division protein FtsB